MRGTPSIRNSPPSLLFFVCLGNWSTSNVRVIWSLLRKRHESQVTWLLRLHFVRSPPTPLPSLPVQVLPENPLPSLLTWDPFYKTHLPFPLWVWDSTLLQFDLSCLVNLESPAGWLGMPWLLRLLHTMFVKTDRSVRMYIRRRTKSTFRTLHKSEWVITQYLKRRRHKLYKKEWF